MPTINIGDRVTLKRTPLYNQIPDWNDDRKIPAFHPGQVFEVTDVNKSKVILRTLDTEEPRFFEWFKNAVKVLPTASEDEDPATPIASIDISHMDRAELESVTEEKSGPIEVRRVPTSIDIHANGAISVGYEEEEVPAAPPAPTGTPLEWAHTGEEFETPVSTYKNLRYWIAGKLERGKKPAELYYFIEYNGKITKSELHYCGVVFANRWAREAIDRLAALQEA
jgi:hypothetical protein